MDDYYKKYEIDCTRIRRENGIILDEFAEWLQAKQLSKTTIKNHVSNIDFYTNEFLLYDSAIEAKDGTSKIGMFLGYWFIRKAAWSSVNQIKCNVASLKKFYTFMYEKNYISYEQLDDLNNNIKEEMPDWIYAMERYDEQARY